MRWGHFASIEPLRERHEKGLGHNGGGVRHQAQQLPGCCVRER